MKPLSITAKILLLVGFLCISYYVGRPIYWEVMSQAVQGHGLIQLGLTPSSRLPPPSETGEHKGSEGDQKLKAGKDEVKRKPEDETNEVDEELKAGKDEAKQRPGDKRKPETSTRKEEPKDDPKKFSSHDVLRKPIWVAPPQGTAMPPREAFTLSKDMIQFRAQKNVILVTFANHAFGDFVLTWVKHLTDVGVTNLLVGAMDRLLLDELFWKGVPVFDMGSEMNTADVGWGTPTFHKMGREKVFLVNAIMAMGFEVLFCDTDMVFLKNPLPYMERYPDADILVSSDAVVATVNDDSLEDWRRSYAALNIGIFHWRPTAESKKFAKAWQEQLEDEKIWDQNGFNDLMDKKTGRQPVDPQKDNGLFYGFDGALKVGILPVGIFCSGHTYFVQHLYKTQGLEPYAVHTTFQFAGTEGKRHRLREAKLFIDKPEYYATPGGFVTFNASIPEELLTGGNHSVDSHFALVNYQMKQVREALAISHALNRTLVMPPIWCRYDRLWFGHPGILPDTKTPQPFLCPMDHVFEVSAMLKPMPEAEFGPMIDFREYSFLENPRVPQKVKGSTLTIRHCNGDCGSDVSSNILEIPRNLTDKQLREKLKKHKNAQVLNFATIQNAFGGFENKDEGLKFRRRVQKYTGIWCCVEHQLRGHIYYDIYWDEKPGWKALPPSRPEEDHPPFD